MSADHVCARIPMPESWRRMCFDHSPEAITGALLDCPEILNSVDYSGTTGVGIAATQGRLVILRALIAAGADLTITDQYGCPPIIHAAGRSHHACVLALLQAGVDPDSRTSCGSTAVYSAATQGDIESLRALAAYGACFKTCSRSKDRPYLAWRPDAKKMAYLAPLVNEWFKPGRAQTERDAYLLAQDIDPVPTPGTRAAKARL